MGLESPVVGVVGGTGRMGSWFVRYFDSKGFRVLLTGKENAHASGKMVRRCDLVVIAVPMGDLPEVIGELSPFLRENALLMDLSSIKGEPLEEMLKQTRGEVVGAHPLFGPEARLSEGLRIALCPGRGVRGLHWLRDLFEASGMKTIILEAPTHDRMMGMIQGVNHLLTLSLALAIQRSGFCPDELLECATQTFGQRVERIRSLLHQPSDLFEGILMKNPAAADQFRQFLCVGEEMEEIVEKGDGRAFKEVFLSLRRTFPQRTGKEEKRP
jgi:prephenate dehydrogenase